MCEAARLLSSCPEAKRLYALERLLFDPLAGLMPRLSLTVLMSLWLVLPLAQADSDPSDALLHELIEDHYGLKVIPWAGEGSEMMRSAFEAMCLRFHRSAPEVDRMNEVGLQIEQLLMESLDAHGAQVQRPRTRSGRGQSSGYPDLWVQWQGQSFYVEVKTFSSHTLKSSQRTFYFSVSEDPKVTENAIHLLAGFEIEKRDDSHHRIVAYHLVDLRELPCKVKVEYNASNRELYGNPQLGFQIHEPLSFD